MKRCGKCESIKPLGDFYVSRGSPDGKQSRCKLCQRSWQREYNEENSERLRAYNKKWQKDRHVMALHAYSAGDLKCAGCGEKDVNVLTLHHVNEDGNQHRRQVGHGVAFINHLIRNNWPADPPLSVLCWNCNHRVRIGSLTLGII